MDGEVPEADGCWCEGWICETGTQLSHCQLSILRPYLDEGSSRQLSKHDVVAVVISEKIEGLCEALRVLWANELVGNWVVSVERH